MRTRKRSKEINGVQLCAKRIYMGFFLYIYLDLSEIGKGATYLHAAFHDHYIGL